MRLLDKLTDDQRTLIDMLGAVAIVLFYGGGFFAAIVLIAREYASR